MNGRAHIVLSDILADQGATNQALDGAPLAVESEPNLLWVVGQNALRLARKILRISSVSCPRWCQRRADAGSTRGVDSRKRQARRPNGAA